jgi:hypothetical protein
MCQATRWISSIDTWLNLEGEERAEYEASVQLITPDEGEDFVFRLGYSLNYDGRDVLLELATELNLACNINGDGNLCNCVDSDDHCECYPTFTIYISQQRLSE